MDRLETLLLFWVPAALRTEALRRFPALSRFWPMQPVTAGLNVTDNCNMRCIMCNSWRSHSANELTTQEWTDVIRQLRRAGIRFIEFAGGEPLLRKDLPELVAEATSLGMRTELTTSGFLLDEARLNALLAAGLGSAIISIDGVGAEYEAIRGRPWGRVEQACELLARAHHAGRLRTVIGFVLMKPTIGHLDGVQRLSARLGLPLAVSLLDASTYLFQLEENQRLFWIRDEADRQRLGQIQHRLATAKQDNGLIRDDLTAIEFFSKYFEDPRQPRLPCAVSQTRILIDSHGMVFGGCWAMSSYGCLRSQSLKSILRSEAYRTAHRKMFAKQCPGCSCGFKVSLKLSLPTQVKELGLRWSKRWRQRVFAPHDLAAPGAHCPDERPATPVAAAP